MSMKITRPSGRGLSGIGRFVCRENTTQPVTREEHFRLLNEWRHTDEWKQGRYDFDALVGKRWEITKELYWQFLEVLPPVCWRGLGEDYESFYMSEALTGNITSMYSRHGDRYFHEYARYPKGKTA